MSLMPDELCRNCGYDLISVKCPHCRIITNFHCSECNRKTLNRCGCVFEIEQIITRSSESLLADSIYQIV